MAEVLKPIYCATALLGIHILCPFLRLLIDTDTTYETLLTAFPNLNLELEKVYPNLLFDSQQVFKFLPNDMFKETLPKDHLLKNYWTSADSIEMTY